MRAPPSAPTPLEDTLTSPTATAPRSAFKAPRCCEGLRGTHRRQVNTLACHSSRGGERQRVSAARHRLFRVTPIHGVTTPPRPRHRSTEPR
eukprot:6016283-Prymnesium_polylepis.1